MSELRRTNVKDVGFMAKMRYRINENTRLALAEFSANRWKLDHNDGFAGIPMQELRKVGLRITECQDVWQVYEVLAEPSSTNLNYYDVIMRPQHLRSYKKMAGALDKFEPSRIKESVDLGTGTGEMALVLGARSDHIIAVDIMPSLLKIAGKKLSIAQKAGKISAFELKVMDILELQLPEESVDVMVGNGIMAYFTNEERAILLQQIRRILKPSGRYYEYHADNLDPPEYRTSARALLVRELVRAIVGFTFLKKNAWDPLVVKAPGFISTLYNIDDEITPRENSEAILQLIKN